MHWHYLAFAAIPVWIFAICAGLKALMRIADDNDDRWWGGVPLWISAFVPALPIGGIVAILIGNYALTGMSS
jgi:hypothetical protein